MTNEYHRLKAQKEAILAKENKAAGLFKIEGFDTTPRSGFGCYGFSITLDKPVVQAVFNYAQRQETKDEWKRNNSFSRTLLQHMKDSNRTTGVGFEQVRFFPGTPLLIGLTVDHQCACFGIDGDSITALERDKTENLLYRPHNIDTMQQAGIVLSTWLFWFNTICAVCEIEQPFAR